ncbi:MAG: VCBS repeat-containing protein [Bacteroidetes bacterium]|nr:VCBS repeat-containing protein [Bacteroidota bacterium]
MKTIVLCIGIILGPFATMAQFTIKAKAALPANAQVVRWADINNDSLLDAVILLKKGAYSQLLAINHITTDSAKTFLLADSLNVAGDPQFIDWNGDNKIDVILPQAGSPNLLALINLGNFTFKKSAITVGTSAFSKVQFADHNNDGQPEALGIKSSGGWSMYKNDHGQFSIASDSSVSVSDIMAFDFNGNGFRDVVLSGSLANGQPFLWMYQFINNFQVSRKIVVPNPLAGKIEIGDVDEDGLFDLLVSGKNSAGQLISQTYLNHDSLFVLSKKTLGLQKPEMLVADLDSDGKADYSFFGSDAGGTTRRWVTTATGDSTSLSVQNLTHQIFGDYDRDGDLDILLSTDTLSVVLLENTTSAKNHGPSVPINTFGSFIFNRLFMYWDSAADDHTAKAALTYDLILANQQSEVLAGEFDLQKSERLTVTHGKMATQNFTLLHIPVVQYSYAVQSIDNSFTVKVDKKFIGHGTISAQGGPCGNNPPQVLTSCNDVPIKLQSPQQAMWFSFDKGFLGRKKSLTVPAKTDTLFSFTPSKSSCDALKIFIIQRSAKDTLKVDKKFIGCQGDTTSFTVASEWTGVTWKDNLGASRGAGNTLHYTVTKNETLIALGSNTRGCVIRQTESVTLSKPVLVLNGDDFKIMQGQSVTLSASGAQEYWWQPATGLSSNTSASPEVSPTKTTLYTLTGFDSLHCSATATVLIEVTNTAFVPTLFTPNGDGKNDELKIYGLTSAKDFHFTIYNREGSVVYETTDVASATNTGWDGTKNGVLQPAGLYYWKVEGNFDNGQPLTLNGKTKGSVMLIR